MDTTDPNNIWEGITPCQAHMHMQDDCTACVAELTARGAVIDQLQADSSKRVQSIVQQGGPMMSASVLMEARLEVLIDSILHDPKDRVKFEGEVGRRIMENIKDVQRQMKQPTLHVPNGRNLRPIRDIPQA